MLVPGAIIELHPERAVVGGRMLARAGGEVVLVSGAIPGERVAARIDRRQQGVWFATTVDVLDASADRRDPGPDPACGGMTFAHIDYGRQCELKALLVADALARIGHLALEASVPLTPSPPEGYRARYRVHAGGGSLGFFREGTHEVCAPSSSRQLAPASLACLEAIAARLPPDVSAAVEAFECLENLPNTQRVVNLAMRGERRPSTALISSLAAVPGVTGVSWTERGRSRVQAAAGQPWVSDPLEAFVGSVADAPAGSPADLPPSLHRHAPAFFQSNRFLTPVLARQVVTWAGEGPVLDLYAGVGLFGVCLAAHGHERVTAIESDPVSVRDLQDNARPFAGRLRVLRARVEDHLRQVSVPPEATMIVDPPRTGMSRAAMQGVLAARARRLVYVSCDVATLARDSRRLLDAGYALRHLEALDLYPDTAHVEGLAVFDRAVS